jgi:hypothetical protein
MGLGSKEELFKFPQKIQFPEPQVIKQIAIGGLLDTYQNERRFYAVSELGYLWTWWVFGNFQGIISQGCDK